MDTAEYRIVRPLEFPVKDVFYEPVERASRVVLGNPDTLERGLEPLEAGQFVDFVWEDDSAITGVRIGWVGENMVRIFDWDAGNALGAASPLASMRTPRRMVRPAQHCIRPKAEGG